MFSSLEIVRCFVESAGFSFPGCCWISKWNVDCWFVSWCVCVCVSRFRFPTNFSNFIVSFFFLHFDDVVQLVPRIGGRDFLSFFFCECHMLLVVYFCFVWFCLIDNNVYEQDDHFLGEWIAYRQYLLTCSNFRITAAETMCRNTENESKE